MKLLHSKLAKAGSLYMIGEVFNKAISLLLIPIITRMLSTSEYGIVNTYLSWVSIFTVFIGLSLGTSFRSAVKDYKDQIVKYESSLFSLSFFVAVIFSLLILGLSQIIDFKMSFVMIICCIVHSYMHYIMNSICIKYMMEFKYVQRTLLLSVPNLITAILSIVLIHFMTYEKYWGRILPYVFVYTIVAVPILFSSLAKGHTFFNKEYWIYALKYSIPLVFHSLSVVVLSSSDRIMISNMRNSSEAGIYSLVYNLSMAVTVVQSTLESIWIPWFTKQLSLNKKQLVNKMVRYYIEVVSVFVCVILLISPELIKVIAPSSYWNGIVLTIPIVLASFVIFLYSISVDLEYYYKTTKYIAVNTAIAASVNLVLNFLLIPKYGANAAAYTTVFAYSVSFLLHYFKARNLDNELYPFIKYVPSIIGVVLVSVICYYLIDCFRIRLILLFAVSALYLLLFFCTDRKQILKR